MGFYFGGGAFFRGKYQAEAWHLSIPSSWRPLLEVFLLVFTVFEWGKPRFCFSGDFLSLGPYLRAFWGLFFIFSMGSGRQIHEKVHFINLKTSQPESQVLGFRPLGFHTQGLWLIRISHPRWEEYRKGCIGIKTWENEGDVLRRIV